MLLEVSIIRFQKKDSISVQGTLKVHQYDLKIAQNTAIHISFRIKIIPYNRGKISDKKKFQE